MDLPPDRNDLARVPAGLLDVPLKPLDVAQVGKRRRLPGLVPDPLKGAERLRIESRCPLQIARPQNDVAETHPGGGGAAHVAIGVEKTRDLLPPLRGVSGVSQALERSGLLVARPREQSVASLRRGLGR